MTMETLERAQSHRHRRQARSWSWRAAALVGALVAALVAWALATDPAQATRVPAEVPATPAASTEIVGLPPPTVSSLSGGMPRLLSATDASGSTAGTPTLLLTSTSATYDLDRGHVDLLAPQLVDGELVMVVKDDTQLHDSGTVFRPAQDVGVVVLESAEVSIPDSLPELGAAGDPVWVLPQTQDQALLWPGWSTEHESLAGQFDGPVTFQLTNVSGPGGFVLFQTVGFGETRVLALTSDGLPASWTEPVPAHVHASWAFGAPGSYTLTFEASGTRRDGTTVSTGPVDYPFVVEGTTGTDDDGPGDTDDPDGTPDDDGGDNGGDATSDDPDDPNGEAPDDTDDETSGSSDGDPADSDADSQSGATDANGGGGGSESLADTGFEDVDVLTASAVSLLLFGLALTGKPRRRPVAGR